MTWHLCVLTLTGRLWRWFVVLSINIFFSSCVQQSSECLGSAFPSKYGYSSKWLEVSLGKDEVIITAGVLLDTASWGSSLSFIQWVQSWKTGSHLDIEQEIETFCWNGCLKSPPLIILPWCIVVIVVEEIEQYPQWVHIYLDPKKTVLY